MKMKKTELLEAIRNEMEEGISLDQAIFYALGDETSEKWKEAKELVPDEWVCENAEEIRNFSEEYGFDKSTFSVVLWIYEQFDEVYTTL